MQHRHIKTFGLLLATAMLAACASVPKGDPQRDAELKTFKAPQNSKAGIYVYRNETLGAAKTLDVSLDGKPIGQTAAKTYMYAEVEPGQHKLVGSGENKSELVVDAIAGKLYYVWQEVKMGMFGPRNQLHSVDEKTGQAGVTESTLTVPSGAAK